MDMTENEFFTRLREAYGQDHGWQMWFVNVFGLNRRTIYKWIQGGDKAVPPWAWAALGMIETIKHTTGEIPMANLKNRGRKPIVGRYETRGKLCEAILRDAFILGMGATACAKANGVTYAVAQRIISRQEGMTKALRQEIAAAKKAAKVANSRLKKAA
jgi:hypothetical protein